MRVLLDECVPKRVCELLPDHVCITVPKAGWAGIKNGHLLRLAEVSFDAFVTVDQNLSFQNRINDRNIAVVVIHSKSIDLDTLAEKTAEIQAAVRSAKPREIRHVFKQRASPD